MAMVECISSSILPALPHVKVPTPDQAAAAVAQVRDSLNLMHGPSQSLSARASSSNHVHNRAVVAYRLITESHETREVITQAVSDPKVFNAIWEHLQKIPAVFGKIVESAKNCLIPRDHEDLKKGDEISSITDRTSWWVRMFQMVVDAIRGVWDRLFAGKIPRIQAAFAGQGDAAAHLETALIITGLAVLVAVVIGVGIFLVP